MLLADNCFVSARQIGEVIIPLNNYTIRLQNGMLVSNLGYNLVSVGRLADNVISSLFRLSDVEVVHQSPGVCIKQVKRAQDA